MFPKINPNWQHWLSAGLIALAIGDEALLAWWKTGNSLPFHLTAATLVAAGYWLSLVSRSVLGEDVTAEVPPLGAKPPLKK
jgi:hypothetical protein